MLPLLRSANMVERFESLQAFVVGPNRLLATRTVNECNSKKPFHR